MDKIQHRTVHVNGINMHIAEVQNPSKSDHHKSNNRTILFLHGFPELWYSWRHQLHSLSTHGYNTVAPDLRGYGDSDAPPCHTSYTSFHVVGDLVALLDVLGVEKVYLVGHDWGAMIAWNFALLRPDRIMALVNLSVPFTPRHPSVKPVDRFRQALGDDFYVCRFQEPGEVEEEFAAIDTARLLTQLMLSGSSAKPPITPKGKLAGAAEKPISLPPWLSEDDVNYYAEKFKQRGFTGGLNYYRAMNLTWELMAPWTGVQVKVPVKFIIGDQDITYHFPQMKDYIHKGGFKRDVPFLEDVVIMEGVGHFANQDKPDEVNKHIQEFFDRF